MCGGSKGQSTSSQTQTYTPNAVAQGYITDALGRAQQTANTGFNLPQAPVAGLSADQQAAFQSVRNAQGMAQPYINQAQNYFQQSTTPNVSQFFNPYADAVTNQMKNIFGQQQAQTTGQLTQAAGGVGADRIAVGQANLANQQGLAAGQTLSQLYAPSLQAAQQQQSLLQGAGYGTASLGAQAQNLALQGANAQLGTGGLQQQQQQAELNAPYQYQVAKAQFPYQQAQWYGSLVGALAPGLGGTTSGQSTSQAAQPSVWSQILGAGLTGAGALGQSGAFGSEGWLTGSSPAYGGGNFFSGDAYGGSSTNPLPGLSASDYGAGYAPGGSVSDNPIDITAHPFIQAPEVKPIQQHIPQLQQQSGGQGGGGGGGGLGDIIGTAAKILPMFLSRGGAVDMKKFDGYDPYTFFQSRFPEGYADGGTPSDEERKLGIDLLRQKMFDAGYEPENVIRAPSPEATDAWRSGVDKDRSLGQTAQGSGDAPLPPEITGPAAAAPSSTAMAFAPQANPYAPAPSAAPNAQPETAPSPDVAPAPGRTHDRSGFIDSPWAALTAAGLGIMGGTSPFAGVNIGQGGMQGLKMLEQQREAARKDETVEQAARRLEMEAKQHEDRYSRETMSDKRMREIAEMPYHQLTEAQKLQEMRMRNTPVKLGQDPQTGMDILGVPDPQNPGHYLDPFTHEPIARSQAQGQGQPGGAQVASLDPTIGLIGQNKQLASAGAYDYSQDAPYIEKGMDVPEPKALAGKSTRAMQTDAEYYLTTGKLPPVKAGKSPVAYQQQRYQDAVKNYGNALASSRGMTPEQMADAWRTAPGMLRFVLGVDGRSTVALGTAVRHLDTLQEAAKAWNANDPNAINRLRAVIAREFGEAAATNLEAAGRIVGPEIIKALGVAGAGTAEERAAVEQAFSTARSPAQIAGAVQMTQKLLGGQLEGRKRQALNAGVSEERFKNLIGERPYEILSHADKAAGNAGASAVNLPEQAKAQLKEGQVTTFGNGQRWTLKNGQPMQVQ